MFVYLVLLNPFLMASLELIDLEHALVPGPALTKPKEQFTLISLN